MGRIQQLLDEAQDGQAFANLARAFHLPVEKVEPAVAVMAGDLIARVESSMASKRSLAGLVELLGKNIHLQVLDNPIMLGATSTQVAGNKVLNVVAGRSEAARMATHAATTAGISEMICEYLLPVVASMLAGALAKENHAKLDAIIGGTPEGPADGEASEMLQLPRASGGGGSFSGITSGTVAGSGSNESRYAELAEKIRRGGASDPAGEVRRILAETLGTSGGNEPPGTNSGAIRSLLAGWRR